ncbi:MAG: DnaJ domain-containing protein [Burkholderiales bacterium]|nr:DnaJ domain-containing protein [Burkholderiales bacterium]
MTASPPDPYDALGVAASASVADIRLAYRRKAALYHPDRNPAADAAARFRDVQAAYELLTDDERRKAYDQMRQKRLLEDPAATARAMFDTYLAEFE